MATGLSQAIGALTFAAYFLQKTMRKEAGLNLARPELSRSTLQAIVVDGSSEMFNSLAVGITTFLLNRMILIYLGELGVVAFALVQYLMMIGMIAVIGICNGHPAHFQLQSRCRAQGACAGGTLGMATLFLPDHPEALALTLEVAWLVRWSMLFMPAATLGSVYFTALEQASKSLAVAVSRGLLLPVLGLALFPAWWGAPGIWITPAFAEGVALLVAAGCFFWKKETNTWRVATNMRMN